MLLLPSEIETVDLVLCGINVYLIGLFCFAVATPKQIRELMQVEGLTNDEVKSHLQVSVFSFFFVGI